MRKTLISLAIVAANFAFGQITLQHSFPDDELLWTFTEGNEMFYVSCNRDENKLRIYNADYTLKKTINIPVPNGYKSLLDSDDMNGVSFSISKHIFNNDDKYEFMIQAYNYDNNSVLIKLLLVNEDGELIKDFNPNPETKTYRWYSVYHDSYSNVNKLVLYNQIVNGYKDQADIYLLPTSQLTTREIEYHKKLSAFPIPTTKTLNIINPQNGSNKIEVYDATGKLVVNKSFGLNENRISIDVERLPKGNYIYKIGNLSSKFIKN